MSVWKSGNHATDIYDHIYQHHMVHIKKETVNILEFKVGNNGNIANLLFLWKPRFASHTCDKRGHNLWFREVYFKKRKYGCCLQRILRRKGNIEEMYCLKLLLYFLLTGCKPRWPKVKVSHRTVWNIAQRTCGFSTMCPA